MEQMIENIVSVCMKLFHINLDEKRYKTILQFIKFGMVGVTNTVVYYLVNLSVMLLAHPIFPYRDYVFGNVAGFIISVLWSFYWNSRFVFKKEDTGKRNIWAALAKAYVSYAFSGVVLSNAISYVLIDLLSVSKYIVPLINSLVGVPINFVLNKLWAFKGQTEV